MASFDRTETGVLVHLDPDEATILARLLEEAELLISGAAETEVTRRLFPDAYEEADDQRAYEELVGDQLRSEKLEALAQVRSSVGSDAVELDEDTAHAWLAVVNDLRLALGTRLGVTEEVMAAELDPEDPDAPALSVLHWLGWMQESLISHLP